MKKNLANKLRDSEKILVFEEVTSWVNKKARTCILALVQSKSNTFELAVFLFKQSRLYMINNKIETISVMPITKELNIFPRNNGFALRWLSFVETQIEFQTSGDNLFKYIKNHIEQASVYQREPFQTGSPTHQWLWYYQNSIHQKLKDPNPSQINPLVHRCTVEFKPEHFNTEIMASYIKEQLKKRESEYCAFENIPVFVGTWNCGGTGPSESIKKWLRANKENIGSPYKILIICLQEICPLTATHMMGDEQRELAWVRFIAEEIRVAYPSQDFLQVSRQSLWGLLNLVYIDAEDSKKISQVAECSVKLGLKGYMGNKGAVCIRFEYLNTNFCVINCHLAAHKKNVKTRNDHVNSILKQTLFMLRKREVGVYEHDHVIWAGDFNYRLENVAIENIFDGISRKDYKRLLKFDQLSILKKSGKILFDFHEEQICFQPTYKYLKGRQEYTENREPSWCDRIFCRGESIIDTYYTTQDILQSDHKPVYAEIRFLVKIVNMEKKIIVQSEIIDSAKKAYVETIDTNN